MSSFKNATFEFKHYSGGCPLRGFIGKFIQQTPVGELTPKAAKTNEPFFNREPMRTTHTIAPDQVHDVLKKHILADGYDVVLDLDKSQGAYLYDSKHNKKYLDFFTFFCFQSGRHEPSQTGWRRSLHEKNSPMWPRTTHPTPMCILPTWLSLLIPLTALVSPPTCRTPFFVAGGALAVENALKTAFDWKVQKNFRKGYRHEKGHMVLHFEQAFHGRSGYTMSLTNTEAQ